MLGLDRLERCDARSVGQRREQRQRRERERSGEQRLRGRGVRGSVVQRGPGRRPDGLDPPCSLSSAYGVSCRARAERVALRRDDARGDSPRGSPDAAPVAGVWFPRFLRGRVMARHAGNSAASRRDRYLLERAFACKSARNLSSKTRRGRVFLPDAAPRCNAGLARAESLALPRVDLGLARQGLRRDRREPRHRPRDRARSCAPRARRCCSSRAREDALRDGGRALPRGRRRRPRRSRCDVTDPDAGRAHARRGRASGSGRSDVLVNNAGTAQLARPRRRARRGLAGGLGAERDGLACARCARSCPACASAAGAAS